LILVELLNLTFARSFYVMPEANVRFAPLVTEFSPQLPDYRVI